MRTPMMLQWALRKAGFDAPDTALPLGRRAAASRDDGVHAVSHDWAAWILARRAAESRASFGRVTRKKPAVQ
jgi:hypothetical protein